MAPWSVQSDGSIDRALRRYKADKSVRNTYHRVVQDLVYSDDPSTMGVPKRGRHAGCFGTHITKSVVLLYRIDYTSHRIDLLELGDHKTVYGSDG